MPWIERAISSLRMSHGGNNESAAAVAMQDAALGAEFKWRARDDKLRKQGLNPDQVTREQEETRAAELRREIEKLKQSRQRRDEERALMLEARGSVDPLGSEVDEDKFQFLQLKRRALLRLREGRPKHMDWLILIYLHAAGATAMTAAEANSHAQHETFALPALPYDALSPQDVLEMLATPSETSISVARLSQQQQQPTSIAAQLLAQQHDSAGTFLNALASPSSSSSTSSPLLANLSAATTTKVVESVLAELDSVKADVQLFIDFEPITIGPNAAIEGYWRAILALLNHKASTLKSHTGPLDSLPTELALPHDDTTELLVGKSYVELVDYERQAKEAMNAPGAVIDDEYWQLALSQLSLFKADARVREVFQLALALSAKAVPTATPQMGAEQDPALPAAKRRKLGEDATSAIASEESLLKDAEKTMENGEEVFDSEVAVPTKHVGWMDKYRPRKPKYFNRVKTGYEWNKYNQTHYDVDNPPPKIVQGYKFNIFYPDLIDKSKTPQYFLEKSDSPDFVILRFHAGPPYEDIAFKIVNKEWEQSQKRGFKCQFSHGILYLWFNFKRYRYRR